jgi:hypothetical protein
MALWLCRTFGGWTLDYVWSLTLAQWTTAARCGRRFRAVESTERAAEYHDPEGTCERAQADLAETEAEPEVAAEAKAASVDASVNEFILTFGRFA